MYVTELYYYSDINSNVYLKKEKLSFRLIRRMLKHQMGHNYLTNRNYRCWFESCRKRKLKIFILFYFISNKAPLRVCITWDKNHLFLILFLMLKLVRIHNFNIVLLIREIKLISKIIMCFDKSHDKCYLQQFTKHSFL